MGFRFKYTMWECVYYVVRSTLRQLLKSRLLHVFLGICILGEAMLGTLPAISNGEPLYRWLLDSLISIVMWLAGYTLLVSTIMLIQLLYSGLRKERSVCMRDGVVLSEITGGGEPGVIPCKNIESVKVSGPLIWMKLPYSAKGAAYLLIPARVFATRAERDEFLENFRYQQSREPAEDLIGYGQREPGVWQVEFELGTDLWVRANTQFLAIKNKRLLGTGWKYDMPKWITVMIMFLIVFVVRDGLKRDVGLSTFVIPILMAAVFTGGVTLICRYRPVKEADIRWGIRRGLTRMDVIGQWKISFGEGGICYVMPSSGGSLSWESLRYLAESDDIFFICTEKGESKLFFKKCLLGGEEQEREFIAYCQAHGVEHRRVMPLVDGSKTKGRKRWILAVCIVAGLVVIRIAVWGMQHYMVAANRALEERISFYEEETTPYVFHPEDYENYVPFDRQVTVLKSLGFYIPSEIIEEYEEWVEGYPVSRVWVEGYPYTSLLSRLGCPEWDTETWEVKAYSDQVYWFDFEGYDISTDYIEILNGINALSGGDFTITDVKEDDRQVDWETWTGQITVRFKLNGKPCQYLAKVEGDWLDAGILSFVEELLEAEQVPGKLYTLGDDGQGCILFYRDRDWGQMFVKKTGLQW